MVPAIFGEIDSTWVEALKPVAAQLNSLAAFVQRQPAVLPEPRNMLRAFRFPISHTRVVIVGQDPYPTPGHAVGLSFSVHKDVTPLPRSLGNIFTELESDLGGVRPVCGDLSAWANNGVMLLNTVLSVAPGEAGAHRGKGWESVTAQALSVLSSRDEPLVAILWGKDAQRLAPLLPGVEIISSAHPSPLSARRGFFGSKPFSRANELLLKQGAPPIDWRLQ